MCLDIRRYTCEPLHEDVDVLQGHPLSEFRGIWMYLVQYKENFVSKLKVT